MTEIITGAASPAGTNEPTMTVSQLEGLLRAAADLERAQRPIVIRSSAEAFGASAVTVQPAVLDFGGRYPSPAEAAGIVPMAPLCRRAPAPAVWGKRFAIASMLLTLAGAADGVAVGTAPVPVVACVLGILGAVAGTARAVHENDRENQS